MWRTRLVHHLWQRHKPLLWAPHITSNILMNSYYYKQLIIYNYNLSDIELIKAIYLEKDKNARDFITRTTQVTLTCHYIPYFNHIN